MSGRQNPRIKYYIKLTNHFIKKHTLLCFFHGIEGNYDHQIPSDAVYLDFKKPLTMYDTNDHLGNFRWRI